MLRKQIKLETKATNDPRKRKSVLGASCSNGFVSAFCKNPAMLERVSGCRTMIFDKTGTLTYGKPVLG